MINSLYDSYKRWSKTGGVYLISDPHFEDSDTKLMNPNWIAPEDYLERINQMIHKPDTLICLGDCGDLTYFQRMKAGYKILIKGNHDDKGDYFYKRATKKEIYDADEITRAELMKKVKEENPNHLITIWESHEFHAPFHRWNVKIDNNLFDEVYSGPLFIGEKLLLSHEPVNGLLFCLNIHGHCHNYHYDYTDHQGGRHLNIAADVVGYQPVELGKLIKCGAISGLPTIHRLTIEYAKENPIHNIMNDKPNR